MVKLIIISMFLCSCGGTIPPYHLEPLQEEDKIDQLICTSTTEHACDGWLGQKGIDIIIDAEPKLIIDIN